MNKAEQKKISLAYIGLGKMGEAMATRLIKRGWNLIVFDNLPTRVARVASRGAEGAFSARDAVAKLLGRKVVWIMAPHNVVDQILSEITPELGEGDVVIDGGNSFYRDTIRRANELRRKGVAMLDAGISGGPVGARDGACVMVGGSATVYKTHQPLFADIAAPNALLRVGENGAGHFVKMVHNGIEYGMMQALSEGFSVLKHAPFDFDLAPIARLYNRRSVIESRLVEWLADAYQKYGDDLAEISGSVAHTGEGQWTVNTAKELGIPVPIITASLEFRKASRNDPSYAGKILSALRGEFGGHSTGGGNA